MGFVSDSIRALMPAMRGLGIVRPHRSNSRWWGRRMWARRRAGRSELLGKARRGRTPGDWRGDGWPLSPGLLPSAPNAFRGRVQIGDAGPPGASYAVVSDGQRFVVPRATAAL